MNVAFLRSPHGLVAAAVVALFAAWHLAAPRPFGDRADENTGFLLTSGWIAVVAYLALALYAVRRAAHRLRLSPEFAWRVPLANFERAQVELIELQNRVARRELAGRAAIQKAAKQIVRAHGVDRVLRVRVERDPAALGLFRLDVGPREALGKLSTWLSAHVWYGIAAALLVWFHGGLRTGSTMGLWLNGLSYLVIGSGLVGALFWAIGPTLLTRAERELSIEKATALAEHFARELQKAEQALASLPAREQEADRAIADAEAKVRAAEAAAGDGKDKQLQKAVKDAQKDLKQAQSARQALAKEQASLPTELEVLRGQSRLVAHEAARLERYRLLLRGWRIVHVPLSVLLLALVAVHVISIWYY